MNFYTRMSFQLCLMFLLFGCSSPEEDRDNIEYIHRYIDSQLGFDYPALIESIESKSQELNRHVSIASRINREMDPLLREPADRSELEKYFNSLSEEEKSASKEAARVAKEINSLMVNLFKAFSVQMAVITVTEEVCGKPQAAEKWQDLFIEISSGLDGKLSDSVVAEMEKKYLRQMDSTAMDYESGQYKPLCSAQLKSSDFRNFAEPFSNN
ncbi:hypothetical protein ACTXGQ_21085 [Marinobacter sp. 1Y8]